MFTGFLLCVFGEYSGLRLLPYFLEYTGNKMNLANEWIYLGHVLHLSYRFVTNLVSVYSDLCARKKFEDSDPFTVSLR